MRSGGSTLHVVVIRGRPEHRVPERTDATILDPGSYFGSTGEVAHHISYDGKEDCLLYVRTDGKLDVVSVQP